MEINNFSLIENYIQDFKGKLYYDCCIIRRGKDHPELPSANVTFKSYFVNSKEDLEKLEQEIIHFCNYIGARAYINLAPKSYEKLAKLTNCKLSERIYTGDFQKIYKCFTSCSGELKGESDAWVIDIDDPIYLNVVSLWIDNWFTSFNKDLGYELKKIHLVIPTLNGYHLITDSFNLQEFKQVFPNIDVHKNNPTVLYVNNDSFSK